MADAADPAARAHRRNAVRAADFTVEHLIAFFDEVAEKLINGGVRPERLSDALKVVATRTTILRANPRGYSGPERRGQGRPWSGTTAKRRPGEPLR